MRWAPTSFWSTPLHAAALVTPMENSPYLPSTRRFGHPLYIRPEKIEVRVPVRRRHRQGDAHRCGTARPQRDRGSPIDRDAVWTGKKEALERIFDVRRSRPGRWPSPIFWLRRGGPAGLRTVVCAG